MKKFEFKKFVVVLLSLGLVAAAFAGCAGEQAAPAAPPQPAGPPTTVAQQPVDPAVPRTPQNLVMWHSMTADTGVLLEELVQEFNETIGAELSITVEPIFQGSYADSSAQLRALLQTDNVRDLPDISQIDATGMIDIKDSPFLARASDFLAVDPDFDISQIYQGMLNNITYMGQLLGMPFAASSTVLYYNRDMFRDAGIAGPPSTLADMAEILPLLTQRNADGSVEVYGFALSPATPTVQNWIGQQNGLSFVVDNNNGREGDPTRVVFDEEGTFATFLEEWKNLYATGGLRHIEGNTREEFTAGRVAMMVGSSANIAPMLRAIDNRFELGVAFYPRVNEDAVYGATIGGSSLFMFDKGDPDRTAAAWEVLKFLASAEIQARWSAGTGYFAANRGSSAYPVYIDNLAEFPHFGVAVAQLEITNPNMQGIWVPSSFQFFMEFRNGIISMLEDDKRIEETVSDIARNLNQLIEDFNEANR